MNIPVFDLHCDTALTLLGETRNEAGSLKKNELHIDLERAAKLEAYGPSPIHRMSFLKKFYGEK